MTVQAAEQGHWVPPELLAASEWNDTLIADRTLQLGETGFDEIWAIESGS